MIPIKSIVVGRQMAAKRQRFIELIWLQCISELPNSDPEIRSIADYNSRLVEEVIPAS
jgi:hypothetical protein